MRDDGDDGGAHELRMCVVLQKWSGPLEDSRKE
jgi:hypothetical protein